MVYFTLIPTDFFINMFMFSKSTTIPIISKNVIVKLLSLGSEDKQPRTAGGGFAGI